MKMTRGAFLESCVVAMAAAYVDPRSLVGNSLRIASATAETFSPHVGSVFTVDGRRLTLAEVTTRPASRHIEQFSLIFHGPSDDRLADGIASVTHRALGSFELSITSVGMPMPAGRTYQAVFCRLIEQPIAPSRA